MTEGLSPARLFDRDAAVRECRYSELTYPPSGAFRQVVRVDKSSDGAVDKGSVDAVSGGASVEETGGFVRAALPVTAMEAPPLDSADRTFAWKSTKWLIGQQLHPHLPRWARWAATPTERENRG